MLDDKIIKYTQLNGISGDEHLVKKELKKEFEKLKKGKIIEDKLGSICVNIPSKKSTSKLGIFVHMDEVGLLVNKILDNGKVKIITVGGISVNALINQRVKHLKSDLLGIVLLNYNKDNVEVKDLEVDFGFASKKEALEYINVGDYISFEGEVEKMVNSRYVTKAADDRIGCTIVEYLAQKYGSKDNEKELFLGATVQEEMGLKGASTLLNAINTNLDHIIIIDVSPIDLNNDNQLGDGLLLRIAEPRGLYDYETNLVIEKLLQKNKIKYQPFFSKGRTDGAAMQIAGKGNKVNALCLPALNLHSSNTIFDRKDMEQIIKAIEVLIENEIN